MKQDKSTEDDIFKSTIAKLEKNIIVSALEDTGGNQAKAAVRLGTTKRMLAYRVQKYGIDIERFRKTNGVMKGQRA